MTKETNSHKAHHGRNVKRFRTFRNINQRDLAKQLGEDWTEDKISQLEEQEEIEAKVLEMVSRILKVDLDFLKEFKEEHTTNNIQNNNDNATVTANQLNNGPNGTVNYDKDIVAVAKRNIELYDERCALLEQIIKYKDEKIASLEKELEKK